jgi:hypothetical protein
MQIFIEHFSSVSHIGVKLACGKGLMLWEGGNVGLQFFVSNTIDTDRIDS